MQALCCLLTVLGHLFLAVASARGLHIPRLLHLATADIICMHMLLQLPPSHLVTFLRRLYVLLCALMSALLKSRIAAAVLHAGVLWHLESCV